MSEYLTNVVIGAVAFTMIIVFAIRVWMNSIRQNMVAQRGKKRRHVKDWRRGR